MLGTDSYARSVRINKISASELSRKFIKSAPLVGMGSENRPNVAFTHTLTKPDSPQGDTKGEKKNIYYVGELNKQELKSCKTG